VADNVTKIEGILNGTTNYMLSKMEDEGAEYASVLAEAQRLGFAEADPTADVEGHDVQAKIALLAKLAFGVTVPVSSIATTGISAVGKADFAFARQLSATVKLLGTAALNKEGELAVFVSPAIVPGSGPLAGAKGAGNLVTIRSDNLTATTLAGPGAGRFPTANSVLNDLVRLSQSLLPPPFPAMRNAPALTNDFASAFYVRLPCASDPAVSLAEVTRVAAQAGVTIRSVLSCAEHPLELALTTEEVQRSRVQAFATAIAALPFAQSAPSFMPIL